MLLLTDNVGSDYFFFFFVLCVQVFVLLNANSVGHVGCSHRDIEEKCILDKYRFTVHAAYKTQIIMSIHPPDKRILRFEIVLNELNVRLVEMIDTPALVIAIRDNIHFSIKQLPQLIY